MRQEVRCPWCGADVLTKFKRLLSSEGCILFLCPECHKRIFWNSGEEPRRNPD